MNLANFANNLDTSGGMNPSALNAATPISKGGTAATTAAAARTSLDVAQAVYAVPSGGIIMWSGSVASIPTGWFLCNGANSTPNLVNRFVLAAGSTYAVGATGGSTDLVVPTHTHAISITTGVESATHTHTFSAIQSFSYGTEYPGGGFGGPQTNNTGTQSANHTHLVSGTSASTGVSPTNANLPPYYALAFIMKS